MTTYGGDTNAKLFINTTYNPSAFTQTQFSLNETSYNYTERINSGAMTTAESTTSPASTFRIWRTLYTNINNIDIKTMSVWTDPNRNIFFSNSNYQGTIVL
jgi:hypothetical protein